MKLKFLALGIIFLALLATASAASTIEITPDPVRDIISSSGTAKFNLVLDNYKPTTVTFLPFKSIFINVASKWLEPKGLK